MRGFGRLPAAFVWGFACFTTVALAADPSMAMLTSGRDGKSRVLLDSGTSPPLTSPSDFRVLVGNGGAFVENVTPFGSGAVHTTLAFDGSGSFKANLPAAVQLARGFVRGLPSDGTHTTGVLTLGAGIRELGQGRNEATVTPLLDRVAAEPAQQLTRLRGGIKKTIEIVNARPASATAALRQVIVFTDGLDESNEFTMQEVIDSARAAGVSVHVVEFSGLAAARARTAQAQTTAATGLDATMRLAASTGGVHLDGASPGAAAGLLEIADSHRRMVWLDVRFCDIASARPIFDDNLGVELTSTGAVTKKLSFSQSTSSVSIAPCPAPVAGARAPVTAPKAAGKAPAVNPPAATGTPWWWWLVGAGAALGAVALVAALVRASRGAPAGAAVVRPSVAPPATPAPVRGHHDEVEPERVLTGGVPLGVLSDLPETQLHVVRGPPEIVSQGYLRINRPLMVVGGFKEDGVDLVVGVQQVSTRHAQFQLYPNGTLWIEDLGSTNGTFLNDRRLAVGERVSVVSGDRIMLSNHVEFRIDQPGRAPPAPLPAASPNPAPAVGVKTTYAPIGAPPASQSDSPSSAPAARPKQKTMYAPVKNPGEES